MLAAASPGALAWNAAGHRLIARLAWSQLSDAGRQSVEHLLPAHPDYAQWRDRLPGRAGARMPDADALLAEASTWADEIRHDPRFFDERDRDARAPSRDGHADMAQHRDWHYLNWPLGKPWGSALRGQLDVQLRRQASVLGDAAYSNRERAIALVWLLHLAADAHQPAHVMTGLEANGKDDDAGGNGFEFIDRGRSSNLHRYWDELGSAGASSRSAGVQARTLARLLEETPPDTVTQGNTEAWLRESHAIAERDLYPGGSAAAPFRVTAAYRENASAVANRQLVRAGVRLGRWLDALLQRP